MSKPKRSDVNPPIYPPNLSKRDHNVARCLINNVRDFVIEHNINNAGIAISGGVDSMALANICDNVKRILGNRNFALIHIAHGLRPFENEKEIELLKTASMDFELPLHIFDGKIEHGAGLEERARNIRYELFAKFCNENSMDGMLVAHNATEDLETLLMRIIDNRINVKKNEFGTQRIVYGIKQISSMNGINIYRPLLHHSKNELHEYAIIMKLHWIEDSSNNDTKYKRNFIRHNLTRLIQEIKPSFGR